MLLSGLVLGVVLVLIHNDVTKHRAKTLFQCLVSQDFLSEQSEHRVKVDLPVLSLEPFVIIPDTSIISCIFIHGMAAKSYFTHKF